MVIVEDEETYEVRSLPWLTCSSQSHKLEDNHNRTPLRKNHRELRGLSPNEMRETVSRSVRLVGNRHDGWPLGGDNLPRQ